MDNLLKTISTDEEEVKDDKTFTSQLLNDLDFVRRLTVPSAANTPCNVRGIAWDDSFFYVCYADNSWFKVAIAAW
ncbi:MAG: hypothetical protein ACTSUF_06190 [Candidatus Heimdallarchaeaceae archaeon]